MEDLTVFEIAEDQVVLIGANGEKYRFVIDDEIRKSIRQVPKKTGATFSPREIQDLARSGKTAIEIAEALGVDENTVAVYAQPIFDEMLHVIELTQTVRLELEPDRFGEVRTVELRELISERSAGATLKWVAVKADGPGWNVELMIGADPMQTARWSFDLRKMLLTPENPVAARLSSTRINEHPLQNLIPTSRDEGATPSDKVTTLAPKAFRSPEAITPSETDIPADSPPEVSSAAVSLAEAIKKRADAAKSHENESDSAAVVPAEPEAENQTSRGVQPESERVKEHSKELVEASEIDSESPEATAKPKGRTSLPSWDQIVFGTKVEDN